MLPQAFSSSLAYLRVCSCCAHLVRTTCQSHEARLLDFLVHQHRGPQQHPQHLIFMPCLLSYDYAKVVLMVLTFITYSHVLSCPSLSSVFASNDSAFWDISNLCFVLSDILAPDNNIMLELGVHGKKVKSPQPPPCRVHTHSRLNHFLSS